MSATFCLLVVILTGLYDKFDIAKSKSSSLVYGFFNKALSIYSLFFTVVLCPLSAISVPIYSEQRNLFKTSISLPWLSVIV